MVAYSITVVMVLLCGTLCPSDVDAQFPPFRGGGRPRPGFGPPRGFGGPGGSGGPGGPYARGPQGRGERPDNDGRRFLDETARDCLEKTCSTKSITCNVLPDAKYTQTCKACIEEACPDVRSTPSFMNEDCSARAYAGCYASRSCPAYTIEDQKYLVSCRTCRNGCVTQAMKQSISQKMKQFSDCRDTCVSTYKCPQEPPKTCQECVEARCGRAINVNCLQTVMTSRACPTCPTVSSRPNFAVMQQCGTCFEKCNADAGVERRERPERELERDHKYLPEATIACLETSCNQKCPNRKERNDKRDTIDKRCADCLDIFCPRQDSTPIFDITKCRDSAYTSTCGINYGCTPLSATEAAAQAACTACRDTCITDDIKASVRSKMQATATCRMTCQVDHKCPVRDENGCRTCLQNLCKNSVNQNCQKNAIDSGTCAACTIPKTSGETFQLCNECYRKCEPERPGKSPEGKKRGHQYQIQEKWFHSVKVSSCLDTSCKIYCSSVESPRKDDSEPKCHACVGKQCKEKEAPSFDQSICRESARATCVKSNECNFMSASESANIQNCKACRNYCIPEAEKQSIRNQMKVAVACRDNCARLYNCPMPPAESCDECISKYCSNSIYTTCHDLVRQNNVCSSCSPRTPPSQATLTNCNTCVQKCLPAGINLPSQKRGGVNRGERSEGDHDRRPPFYGYRGSQ